jgi:hypothetical protein
MLDGPVSRIDGRLESAKSVRVSGEVREGEGADGGGAEPAVPPTNIPAKPASTTPPHPFTAFITMARVTDPACSVPPGGFGAAKVGVYRVVDANGEPVTSKITMREQFNKLDGPDEFYKLLHPNTYEASKGAFDDCYSLTSPKELPDFRLKVEQNHLVDGEIISKNHITYSPSGITICSFKRTAKGWSDNCKRF